MNAASVAPARLFAVPNSVMPVIVKVRGGPAADRMRTVCPTLKPYFCAVPASITTSSERGRRAARDQVQRGDLLVRVEGDGQGGRAAAVAMALPSRATNWA